MSNVTWYRRRCWQLKGKREYTKSGYEYASSFFVKDDLDVDCTDRHFLITGSNSGIGLQTALDIATRGGVLHLVCRNRASMIQARGRIITTTGNDKIHMYTLDLSRPRDVCRWANDFASSHNRLDVVINNAGTISEERHTDEDGIESNFAIHCLSPHILIFTLLPLLQRSDDPRIITVSSAELLKVKLDTQDLLFEKMDPFDGFLAHSQTKRQQVVLTYIYAQLHESVRFYSVHPGWVDTPSIRRCLPEFYEEMKGNLRNVQQGADTIVWLAVSQAAIRHRCSGLFFQDRHPTTSHLPLAWTRHTVKDEQILFKKINCLLLRVSSKGNNSALENAAYGYANYLKSKEVSRSNTDGESSLVDNESLDSLTAAQGKDSISTNGSEDSSKRNDLTYDHERFEEFPGPTIMGIPSPPSYEDSLTSLSSDQNYDSLPIMEDSPFETVDLDGFPDETQMQHYLRERLESIPEENSIEMSGDDVNGRSDRSLSNQSNDESSLPVNDSMRRPVVIPFLINGEVSNKSGLSQSAYQSLKSQNGFVETKTDEENKSITEIPNGLEKF